MLHIRRVQTDDIDTEMNARLDHLLLDEEMHWDADQGRRFLADDSNALFLAEIDGVAIGFATVHRLQRFDARRAEVLIYDIGVEEGARRQGVGRALIAHINAWAKEAGADQVWVLADGDDERACAFYAGTGGERFGPDAAMFTYYLDETRA